MSVVHWCNGTLHAQETRRAMQHNARELVKAGLPPLPSAAAEATPHAMLHTARGEVSSCGRNGPATRSS